MSDVEILLDRQAEWIARRLGISHHKARLIAGLAFSKMEARHVG
jgi:hypothetical protein